MGLILENGCYLRSRILRGLFPSVSNLDRILEKSMHAPTQNAVKILVIGFSNVDFGGGASGGMNGNIFQRPVYRIKRRHLDKGNFNCLIRGLFLSITLKLKSV